MIIIKSMIGPANPHLRCFIEDIEENYYYGISGGIEEEEEGTEE